MSFVLNLSPTSRIPAPPLKDIDQKKPVNYPGSNQSLPLKERVSIQPIDATATTPSNVNKISSSLHESSTSIEKTSLPNLLILQKHSLEKENRIKKEIIQKVRDKQLTEKDAFDLAQKAKVIQLDQPFLSELLRMNGLNVKLALKNLGMLFVPSIFPRDVVLKGFGCLSDDSDKALFVDFFKLSADELTLFNARRQLLCSDEHLASLKQTVAQPNILLSLEELADINDFAKQLQKQPLPAAPVKYPSKKTGLARSLIHTTGDSRNPSNKVYIYFNKTERSRIPDLCISRKGSASIPKLIIDTDTLEWGICRRIINEDRQKLAQREVTTLCQIDSPHVIKTEGFFVSNGKTHVVHPTLYNRGDLKSFLAKTSLTRQERIDIALQMARGLKEIHEKTGLIHGDLQNENVLVEWKNGKYSIVLADLELLGNPAYGEKFSRQHEIDQFLGDELFYQVLANSPAEKSLIENMRNGKLAIDEVISQLETMLAQDIWIEDLRKAKAFDCSPSV